MKERAVLVVVKGVSRPGVFFGYTAKTDGDTIKLKRARVCVYWSVDLRGFMGLASAGPNGSCRIGPAANGGHSDESARPGLIQEISGPLKICSNGFHATFNPSKWNGERLWLVALHGPVQRQEDKIAALKREIIAEVPMMPGKAVSA